MKKWLCLAVASQNLQTYRKYVTFFVACGLLFSGVKSAAAQLPAHSTSQNGKIAITATVLPSQSFLTLLEKNSRVSLEKTVIESEQIGRIEVCITTGGHEKFTGHTLVLSIRNTHAEEVVSLSGITDDSGKAVFEFVTNKQFFGENTVGIVDRYYDVPVILDESTHFIVYEEEQEDTHHEKDRKTEEVSRRITLPHTFSPEVFMCNAENLGNNGTITIQKSLSLLRMGVEDP